MLAIFVILSVLAPQSLCICARDERYPMSTCSSIIIVPKRDIVNNSVTLIVELQSHFESECQNETTVDAHSEIDGTYLRTILYKNNTLKVFNMQTPVIIIFMTLHCRFEFQIK